MANLYEKYLLPRITNVLCASRPVMKQRQKVVPLAYGTVLEIGVGTGLNLPYYDPEKIDHLIALDPSEEMWSIAQKEVGTSMEVRFVQGYAEQIPIEDQTVDSIILTYTLCTIIDVPSALQEMRRVLKPSGQLIFCEHGIAPDRSVQKWQHTLNPIWKKFGGGCNLNRNIPNLIKEGNFSISKMDTMYIPGFRPACFNYWGFAKPID